MSVRVRFAPSPTGKLHLGALRTVLFNYLFAKHNAGANILRIEDTDRTRYNPDSEQEFVDSLRWVGIEFQEGPHIGGPFGPYRQSERSAAGIYTPHIEALLASGKAYKAFDTPQELEEMREFQQINKAPIGYYGGDWREATQDKVDAAIAEGKPYVVRQKVPRDTKIVVQDAIRGKVEFDSNILPDPVLIKGDGMPTYHFAAMVDDHLMEITHVFRGEEWISTSPYHWLLFEQFGWTPPVFIHCPVILGSNGKKLSKRDGATRVMDYMAMGYFKESLKNFVALIGWSPGDEREVLTETEMIDAFGIEGLQPSPGKFDIEKLKWLTGHSIRALTPEQVLVQLEGVIAEPYTREFWAGLDAERLEATQLPEAERASFEKRAVDENKESEDRKDVLIGKVTGAEVVARVERLVERAKTDRDYVLSTIREEQQRVTNLIEFGSACEFFLVDEPKMDAKAVDKWFGQPHVRQLLTLISDECGNRFLDSTLASTYEEVLKSYPEVLGIDKIGPVVHPTRVALTGKTTGPGLFELMSILGPDRIKQRIARALTYLPEGN